jgi:peptidoglycan/xylan/chitin deacetylase (PgdA/CDA1 family)
VSSVSTINLPQRVNHVVARHIPVKPVHSALVEPVASISFDDFPRSAWIEGGPILKRHNAKATYYAAGRFCGQFEDGLEYYTADDLRQVRDAGHEIGCHTFSHEHATGVDSAALHTDALRNQAFVNDVLGEYRLTSFAYPYGDVSVRTKLLFSRRFATCRGIQDGVNAGLVDLAQLKAIGLERGWWNPALIESEVEAAVRRRGWIIFFTHDVSDSPSEHGATPEMLDHALTRVREVGVDILPVKDALAGMLSAGAR